MRGIGKRVLAIVLVLTMIFQLSITSFASSEALPKVSEVNNNFVKLRVRTKDGRFSIKTKEGNPARKSDNDQNLLYEDREPETSFTTFRIIDDNGEKDYIYGNKYGFLNLGGEFIQKPQVSDDGMINSSTWKIGTIEIKQYLELIDDPENTNAGNVKVRYEVTNKGNKEVQVGSRMLLDTMIGDNDGSPVVLGTDLNPVIIEKQLEGEAIPQYYRSMDDSFSPRVMAYGFLDGWGNTKPNKMVIGHYEGLSSTKWEYSIDPTMKFIDESNKYGSADSSIALYWNPINIPVNETKVFETYYGVGNVQGVDDNANFSVNLMAPGKLVVNSKQSGYEQDTIDVVVELDNTLEGAEALKDVQLSLILGDGLEVESSEVPYRHFDSIEPNEIKNMTFRVKARPQNNYQLLKYRVDVTTATINEPISYNDYILAPGLKGEPPAIQYHNITPSHVYYKGDKYFTINGSGYDFYSDKTNWSMYLESTLTEESKLVDRNDIIVSGEKMMVNYPDELDIGEYKIIIRSNVLGTEEVLPYLLTVSDDDKYMSKAYGLMGIKKIVEIEDNKAKTFKYEVVMAEDEDALKSLRDEIERENKVVLSEHNGNLQQLLMEIRGEIVETQEDGNKKYVIKTDTVPAVINGVVQYKGEPITIEKKKNLDILVKGELMTVDRLKLSGNGDLSLVGGFNFWKWDYEIVLDNNKDYSLDAISAEDINNIDPSHKDAFIKENIEYVYISEPIHAQEDIKIEFTGLGKMAKYMGGFLIQINHAVLQEDAVSFGGAMALTFIPTDAEDPFAFSADIEEVLFKKSQEGKTKFEGINVTTEIGLPEDMIGGILENGGAASLTINTIEKIYSIEASMEIKTIECTGLLTIRFTNSNKPVLDDIEFSASVPKIPVFPPTLYINKLGGGINDLYGTLTGNVTAPPLKVLLMAGIELVDENMWQGDVRLTVSKLGLSITGELELVPISSTILKDVHLDARWADPWHISLGAELDLLGILVGNIDIYVSSSWFEGKAYAALQIPKKAPIIGGKKFAEASLGVNSDKIWGSVYIKIWLPFKTRKIGVGVAYYWKGGLKVADANNSLQSMPGIYNETIFTEDNEPIEMVVGTNLKRLGSSNSAFASKEFGIPLVYASGDETKHFFNVYKQDIAVFQIDYDGSQPSDLTLYRPNKVEYPLVSPEGDTAYVIKEGTDGGKSQLYIFVPEPDQGTWELRVNKPVQSTFLEMKEVPELQSVNAMKDNESTIHVSWEAEYADEANVRVSLVANDKQDEAGILLKNDIKASLGQCTVDIPKGIHDGEYKIRVELKERDYGYQTMLSDALVITNPNNPPAVEDNITLSLLGNGQIGVEFENVTGNDIQGYYVEVFTPSGDLVDKAGEYFVEQGNNEAVIGGKYRSKDILDENGDVVVPGQELGLDTGKTYKIGITTIKESEGIQYISSTTYTDTIDLPNPNPPSINLTLENSFNNGQDDEGNNIIIIKDGNAIIDFTSNQNATTTVKINDDLFTSFEGKNKKIIFPVTDGSYLVEVSSQNTNKDIAGKTLSFTVDTTPPVLLIESPEKNVTSAMERVTVSGVSEPEAQVTVNGLSIEMDSLGRFEKIVYLDNVMKETILVEAKDKANNVSTYKTEIVNKESGDINKVMIRPKVTNMRNGTSQSFTLLGVDSKGNEIILDSNTVKWSVISGSTLVELSEEGLLTAYRTGEVVIKGSYYVSDDYAFEDAITIQVVDNDDLNGLVSVAVQPQVQNIHNGSKTAFNLIGLDNVGNEIVLDQNLVNWSITKGEKIASITRDGVLSTNGIGKITVKGAFEFTLLDVFEKTMEINIYSGSSSNNNNTINKELQEILNNIISREKNIIVLSTRDVKPSMDNNISIGSTFTLIVPKGALIKDDKILIGKVKEQAGYGEKALGQQLSSVNPVYEIILAQSTGNLKKPVELSFEFDTKKVQNMKNVAVYYFNEKYGKWEYVGGNIEGNKIKVSINHFSKYAVFENIKAFDMVDIEGIWSKDYIKKLVSLNIANGINKNGVTYYEPKRKITRLELTAMIARVMADQEASGQNPPFKDWKNIPHWGKDYVRIAYNNGWIKGVNGQDGLNFYADRYATRSEVAAIIGRLIQDEKASMIKFTDGDKIPSWAKQQVSKLVSKGIISGYPDGSYRPNNYITREEVAKMVSIFIETGIQK